MQQDSLVAGLRRHIRKSTKPVTILLTDIEGSTEYFEKHGDIEGRLLVDQHNRLVFPVISRFRGKIIKTTGDGVMASFRVAADAIKAAIAIQQLLAQQRRRNASYVPRVRIGVHTGEAIIEDEDVFGDVVNVAVRLSNRGKGDEILISGQTAAEIEKKEFRLARKGSFRPKGKSRALTIYHCQWTTHPNLIADIQIWSFLPIIRQQKLEIFIYFIASVGVLYFLYLKYLRYIAADHEYLALLILNPQMILAKAPVIPGLLFLVTVAGAAALYAIQTVPHYLLRLLKGGFGFCLGFFALYVPINYVPIDMPNINTPMFQSRHLFVEVLHKTRVHRFPALGSQALMTVDRDDLLLLADVTTPIDVTWNKVLIGKEQYGWVPRVLPATVGEPEKRLTLTNKFSFRYSDLAALIVALGGFAWGFMNLRIRPT